MVLTKEFKIGDLFEVTNGKKYPLLERIKGSIPLVSTSALNKGISDYVSFPDNSFKSVSNVISVAYSGSVGATYYHENTVFIGETVMYLTAKTIILNSNIANFIVTKMRKSFTGYDYGRKLKISEMRNQYSLNLPVKSLSDTEPDWEYMENYIEDTKLKYLDLRKDIHQKQFENLLLVTGRSKEEFEI